MVFPQNRGDNFTVTGKSVHHLAKEAIDQPDEPDKNRGKCWHEWSVAWLAQVLKLCFSDTTISEIQMSSSWGQL